MNDFFDTPTGFRRFVSFLSSFFSSLQHNREYTNLVQTFAFSLHKTHPLDFCVFSRFIQLHALEL